MAQEATPKMPPWGQIMSRKEAEVGGQIFKFNRVIILKIQGFKLKPSEFPWKGQIISQYNVHADLRANED